MANQRDLERLEKLKVREEEIKNRRKAVETKIRKAESTKKRKERNHRLILIGAEVEKYTGEVDIESWKILCAENSEFFKSWAKEKNESADHIEQRENVQQENFYPEEHRPPIIIEEE